MQLQVIDDELAKFDQRSEENVTGSVSISGGVSARVVDLVGFLKKLFHSTGSSKQDSMVQRVSRQGRQQNVNSREMESILLKRMRQNSDEEREEEGGHRKKMALPNFIKLAEVDE